MVINVEIEVNYDKSFYKKCGLLIKVEFNFDRVYLYFRIFFILVIIV